MNRRQLCFFAVTGILALAFVAVASAAADRATGPRTVKDGGSAISNGPSLPIGVQVTGGDTVTEDCCDDWYRNENTAGTQYYRVLLAFGDHLTIDYGLISGYLLDLCILQPSVTDYTLADAQCVAADETQTKNEFHFTAPTAGTWTLAVGDDWCCGAQSWSYELTASIKHLTHTTLAKPPITRRNASITYRGTVSGVTSGQVELESRSAKHPAWKPFAVTRINANGAFAYKTRVAATGTYRIKAVYRGDSAHLASSAITSFNVI